MSTLTTEQIDAAIPNVATDESTYEPGQPRRDGMNAALKALRTDVVALEDGLDALDTEQTAQGLAIVQAQQTISALALGKAEANHAHGVVVSGGAAGFMTGADKNKLDSVAASATANATDSSLRDRSTHTGTQAISTVTGLEEALGDKLSASAAVPVVQKATPMLSADAVLGTTAAAIGTVGQPGYVPAGGVVSFTGAQLADLVMPKSIIERLVSGMDAAAGKNAFESAPLTALDNWTTGQTVRAGYSVNASGRWYMYTASGVTGAVAPTHTGIGTVLDGTATALYLGAPRVPVAAVDVPTVTPGVAKPAIFSKRHDPLTQAGKFIFSGGVAIADGANTGVLLSGYSTKTVGDVVVTTPGKSNNNPAFEFMTDAPVFYVNSAAFNVSASFRLIVEVDGYRLKDSALMGLGGGNSIRFDLSAYPTKVRRIRIHWTQAAAAYVFEGVWTEAGYNIWSPDHGLSAVVIGTSLTQGSGYSSFVSGLGWPDYFASLCGLKTMHNVAQGSSGLQVTGASRFSWQERISDVTSLSPDIVFIEGPHNDVGYSGASQLAANTAFITSLRTALPNALIVCLGTNAELLSQNAGMIATETNMAAAVAALGDPMVIFVPVMTDPDGAWFFGYRHAGTISAMTAGVNAQITLSVAPTCVVGDTVVPFSVTGATGSNGLIGHVTAIAGNVVTTDLDTTSAGAFTGPSGYLQVNDVWTSQDGVHHTQRAIARLAQRYARGLRKVLVS